MFISAAVFKGIYNLKIVHRALRKSCQGGVSLAWVVPVPVLESPSTSSVLSCFPPLQVGPHKALEDGDICFKKNKS